MSKRIDRLRRVGRIAIVPMAVYVGLCAAMYLKQDSIIYPRGLAGSAGAMPDDVVPFERQFDGGLTYAWLALPQQRPAPLLVFFHGNAELIDHNIGLMRRFQSMGFAVLMIEYRGYGDATGKPAQAGLTDDAAWFIARVLTRQDIDANRVVYFGRSLGGAVAADVVARRKPAAMILQSTFTSATAMAREMYMPSLLVAHPYRTDRALAAYDGPVLILHGTHDDIISVEHGRALASIAPRATMIEFDCNHNDFPGRDVERYWQAVETFLHDSGIMPADQTGPARTASPTD